MEAKFLVIGVPFGKQRPRLGRGGRTYTPAKTVNYENLVKLEYHTQCSGIMFPQDVPLDIRIKAYYPIPKSTSRKKTDDMEKHKLRPTKKPDWDNIGKTICDSLNGIAYHDDAQIVDAMVRKFYSSSPRVEVVIKEAWVGDDCNE